MQENNGHIRHCECFHSLTSCTLPLTIGWFIVFSLSSAIRILLSKREWNIYNYTFDCHDWMLCYSAVLCCAAEKSMHADWRRSQQEKQQEMHLRIDVLTAPTMDQCSLCILFFPLNVITSTAAPAPALML